MKKSLFTMGRSSVLAACFLLVAMLFGAQDLSAQLVNSGTPGSTIIKASGSWVSSNDAVNLLNAEANQLEATLVGMGLNQGNSTTDQMKIKVSFYRGIATSIVGGTDVPTAIQTNYDVLLGQYSVAVDTNASASSAETAQFKTLFNQAVDLLNN